MVRVVLMASGLDSAYERVREKDDDDAAERATEPAMPALVAGQGRRRDSATRSKMEHALRACGLD
jgi:hypothetical protein